MGREFQRIFIMATTLSGVVNKFLEEYNNNTPKKIKIIDAYLTYIFFTGIFQFVYCCLVGTFPFNAFLSGFISSVASFVRMSFFISLWSTLLVKRNRVNKKKNKMCELV